MPCTSPSLILEAGGRKPPPASPTYDSTPESPALIVSNSPERITTTYGTAKVLYRGYGSDELDSFRLFIWHLVNRRFIGFPSGVEEDMPAIEFGLMFKTSVTGTVSDRKQILKVEGWNDPSIPGSCLANAQLKGTLDSESGSFSVGGSGAVIWSAESIPQESRDCLVAAVLEFDLSTSWPCTYTFQVYMRREGQSLPAWDAEVMAEDSHERGWWPYSSMKLNVETPVYDAKPGASPQSIDTGICEANGPETTHANGFKKLSGDGHAYDKVNKGCYGVNLIYTGKFKNTASSAHNIFAALQARDTWTEETNAKYWGASMYGGYAAQVPPLKGTSGGQGTADDHFDFANLLGKDQFWSIAANTSEVVYELHIANGGAAALPVDFLACRTLDVAVGEETPPGDG